MELLILLVLGLISFIIALFLLINITIHEIFGSKTVIDYNKLKDRRNK